MSKNCLIFYHLICQFKQDKIYDTSSLDIEKSDSNSYLIYYYRGPHNMYKNSLFELNYLDWLKAFQGFFLKFILNQLDNIEWGTFENIAE